MFWPAIGNKFHRKKPSLGELSAIIEGETKFFGASKCNKVHLSKPSGKRSLSQRLYLTKSEIQLTSPSDGINEVSVELVVVMPYV